MSEKTKEPRCNGCLALWDEQEKIERGILAMLDNLNKRLVSIETEMESVEYTGLPQQWAQS